MDNIQIILYIVFAAIAILSRILKSNKNTQKPPRKPTATSNTDGPVSFEDLLKEFTNEAKSNEPSAQAPTEYTEVREYGSKPPVYDDSRSKDVYEKAIQNSQNLKSINELKRVEHDRPLFKHFDEYEDQENNTANELFNMLKDENEVKKAVILSEILNRKY